MSTSQTFLVCDDDTTFRERLGKSLQRRGFSVVTAENAEQAISIGRTQALDYATIDLKMPGKSGLEVVKELRGHSAQIKILVLTGYGSIATAVEAMRLGATNYLTKPVDIEQILAAFERRADAASTQLDSDVEAETPATPSLARLEWEHINRVLQECAGNISEAARILGMHRRSLQRKLAKYPVAR